MVWLIPYVDMVLQFFFHTINIWWYQTYRIMRAIKAFLIFCRLRAMCATVAAINPHVIGIVCKFAAIVVNDPEVIAMVTKAYEFQFK